ncbi:MAG TPA: amidohydrolase family protein [Anseongella sp.]|nr:amidohydrolase family protein [Anseongella sp.]
MNRRDFCQNSVLISGSLALSFGARASGKPEKGPAITDTYINLFEWPFRKLKYSDTGELVRKLKQHGIGQAWAGSFEALFHKDMGGVNARLSKECKKHGNGMLLPIGSVNTSWPGWEEDLRRCSEVHQMKGIRVFPIYQMTALDSPEFLQLVEMTVRRGLFLQIVGDVEDPRHLHPLVKVRDIPFEPLLEVGKKVPGARIQLVHWNRKVGAALMERIARETSITFDISRVEGAGEVGRLIAGNSWYGPKSPLAAERLLFGSHAPYFPVESALLKLFESPLTEAQLRLIMAGNAAKLLG